MSLCPKEAAAPTGETGRSRLLLGPGAGFPGTGEAGTQTHTVQAQRLPSPQLPGATVGGGEDPTSRTPSPSG